MEQMTTAKKMKKTMTNDEKLEKLKLLTGESDDKLLSLYLSLAIDKILDYTNRKNSIPAFDFKQIELAQFLWEKRGVTASTSLSEGGITTSFLTEEEILQSLASKRIARVGGKTCEKKPDEGISSV